VKVTCHKEIKKTLIPPQATTEIVTDVHHHKCPSTQ